MHEREAQEWRAGPPYPLVDQGWQQDGLAALARRSPGTDARRRRTGVGRAPVARQLGAFSIARVRVGGGMSGNTYQITPFMHVVDLNETVEFFTDVLGFKEV